MIYYVARWVFVLFTVGALWFLQQNLIVFGFCTEALGIAIVLSLVWYEKPITEGEE